MNNSAPHTPEDNDPANREPHNSVAAGKEAIAAGKAAAGNNPQTPQQQQEESKDAEQWRNEG